MGHGGTGTADSGLLILCPNGQCTFCFHFQEFENGLSQGFEQIKIMPP